jgi:hypothetical protein
VIKRAVVQLVAAQEELGADSVAVGMVKHAEDP